MYVCLLSRCPEGGAVIADNSLVYKTPVHLFDAMADGAKAKRGIAKGLFTKAQKKLRKALDGNADVEIVEGRMSDVKKTYNTAQERHEEYMSTLGISEGDNNYAIEDSWISTLDDEYDEIEGRKNAVMRKTEIVNQAIIRANS